MNAHDSLRILPEIILTLTGILVMLIDASLPVGTARRIRNSRRAVGQPVAIESTHGDRLLRSSGDKPIHRIFPCADLRHRAGGAAALAGHAA